MYKLVGLRKNGMKVHKEYDNINVALFEFEVTSTVATKLELFEDDIFNPFSIPSIICFIASL